MSDNKNVNVFDTINKLEGVKYPTNDGVDSYVEKEDCTPYPRDPRECKPLDIINSEELKPLDRDENAVRVIEVIPEGFVKPEGTFYVCDTGLCDVSGYQYSQVQDDNLKPENIVKGTTILGVEGVHESSGGSSTSIYKSNGKTYGNTDNYPTSYNETAPCKGKVIYTNLSNSYIEKDFVSMNVNGTTTGAPYVNVRLYDSEGTVMDVTPYRFDMNCLMDKYLYFTIDSGLDEASDVFLTVFNDLFVKIS